MMGRHSKDSVLCWYANWQRVIFIIEPDCVFCCVQTETEEAVADRESFKSERACFHFE
jgi:hypothetical protein